MRRPVIFIALMAAVSVAASGCVVVSGNRAELSPGLMTSCGEHSPGGVQRAQIMEATSGFERLERIEAVGDLDRVPQTGRSWHMVRLLSSAWRVGRRAAADAATLRVANRDQLSERCLLHS